MADRKDEGTLTLLGNKNNTYPDNYAPEMLQTFLNKHPENDYFVKFNCPEFTSLCPIQDSLILQILLFPMYQERRW